MIWGSVVDAYDSFDPDYVGDAGPIVRSIAGGSVDNINWLASSQRLLFGGDLNEYAARSSSLDEPLTPTAFTVKRTSSQGSASIHPVIIDSNVVFVNRTTLKIFENTFNTTKTKAFDFSLVDLCQLVPEIGSPKIVRMTVQRQPDTRIHCVRSDGTVALAVFDKAEDVLCWCEIETDGEVEDAVVLPAQTGVTDDYVYYLVKRTIDGNTVRYLEKWAQAGDTLGIFGVSGAPSLYNAFGTHEITLTDTRGTEGDNFEFFYNPSDGKFYAAGPAADAIFVHEDDPWISTATQIDALDNVYGAGRGICMSREGRYVWISGDDRNFGAGTDSNVRVLDTTTGVVKDMGLAYAASTNIVLAATEVPEVRVWIGTGTTIKMFKPTIATGTLGAAIWTVVNVGFDFNQANAIPLTWDDEDGLWWVGGTHLVQIKSATGVYAIHGISPVSGNPGLSIPTFDPTRRKWYVIRRSVTNFDAFLDEYSGWNATPTNDSGTWTNLLSYPDVTGAYYGIWIYYDDASKVLFMMRRVDPIGGIHWVYRYNSETWELIDSLYVSNVTATADIYPYDPTGQQVFYKTGGDGVQHGYIGIGGDSLAKLYYTGTEILYDAGGNSLITLVSSGINALADSFVNYSGVPISTVTGLDHIEGEQVVVWADGKDVGTTSSYGLTYTVSGGQITLSAEYSNITVGLLYTSKYQSSKLGLTTQQEVLFGKEKRITHVALVLADTHAKGIRFGPDFDNLDDRPENEGWTLADSDRIDTAYDSEMIDFPGEWTSDARICLQAQAPRPCTVLAVKLDMEI